MQVVLGTGHTEHLNEVLPSVFNRNGKGECVFSNGDVYRVSTGLPGCVVLLALTAVYVRIAMFGLCKARCLHPKFRRVPRFLQLWLRMLPLSNCCCHGFMLQPFQAAWKPMHGTIFVLQAHSAS
jgi:hypothetical protein